MKKTLSIYGSHDAGATFIDSKNKLRVLEYERFVGVRYSMYSDRFDKRKDYGTTQVKRVEFLKYINRKKNRPLFCMIFYF